MTFLVTFSNSEKSHRESIAHLRDSNAGGDALQTYGNRIALRWQPRFCSLATVGDMGTRHIGIGRCRLDCRDALVERLEKAGASVSPRLSDLDLATNAYAIWGRHSVDYIHGDFALLVWDESENHADLVRDRLGVHNLAYLPTPDRTWISNSVDALSRVPDLDRSQLDSVWIANFLGKYTPDANARSAFQQIRRLPPSYRGTISPSGVSVERYWALQPDTPLHLENEEAYLERFHELLAQSIKDRTPAGELGISLSGGLDSATLAAKSVEIRGSPNRICADSWVMNGEADPEYLASSLVADYLSIDHHITEASTLHFDPAWQARSHQNAEPCWSVLYPPAREQALKRMASAASTWFYGEGPDNALTFEWRAYLSWLVKARAWGRTARAVVEYIRTKPPVDWMVTIQSIGARAFGQRSPRIDFDWIKSAAPEKQRAEEYSWRPNAQANFNSGIWAEFLEKLERDEFTTGISWRHPFLQTDLLEFMLRTPPIPWGREKALIRKAMRGYLPEETIHRKKHPLYVDIYGPEFGARLSAGVLPKGGIIEKYVDLSKVPAKPNSGDETEAVLRVLILDQWLQSLETGHCR